MFRAKLFKLQRIGAFFLALVLIFWNVTSASFAESSWRIRINIPEFKLELYNGAELFRAYPVAVGKPGTPSPIGAFYIAVKVPSPTWYPPDHKQPPIPPGPNNPLGKYWLGLNIKGYGIHGNSAPWSIGSSVSLGCFRMHNPDIEELFRLVPALTPVEITYQTVRASIDEQNQAWLEVFSDIYNRAPQSEAIANALAGLKWSYELHQPALAEMLTGKPPSKIMLPRRITIEGGGQGIDGFYWNGEVYLSKNILEHLPVSQGMAGVNSFGNYLELKGLSRIEYQLRYIWNESFNTLYLTLPATPATSSVQTPP